MAINPIGGLSAAQIQSMDIETLMMTVQSQRANLLETQLKDQIAAVSARNQQVAKLNELLNAANQVLNGFVGDAKSDSKLSEKGGGSWFANEKNLNSQLAANGITIPSSEGGGAGTMNGPNGTDAPSPNGINGNTTKGQIETIVQKIKSQIDSLTNTQQMDMLRLQSLNNKRNEAFDLMSNFVKKMQDSRSSILSNMR
jgi:archaellum component FlaC